MLCTLNLRILQTFFPKYIGEHTKTFSYSHQILIHTYVRIQFERIRLGLWATAPMFFLQLLLSNIQVSFKSWHSYIFISFCHTTENTIQRKLEVAEANDWLFLGFTCACLQKRLSKFAEKNPTLLTHTSPFLNLTFSVFAKPFQQVCEYAHHEDSQCLSPSPFFHL